MNRFSHINLAFAALMAMTACQTTTSDAPATQAPNRAFKVHLVQESIDGFIAVCLAKGLTVNKAKALAKEQNVGLVAPLQTRLSGNPQVDIAAQRGGQAIRDADATFQNYRCGVSFRGTWASTVEPQVRKAMEARGFRFLTPLKPVSPLFLRSRRPGAQKYAVVSRNGRRFALAVGQAGSSRDQRGDVRYIYLSGTFVVLDSLVRDDLLDALIREARK